MMLLVQFFSQILVWCQKVTRFVSIFKLSAAGVNVTSAIFDKFFLSHLNAVAVILNQGTNLVSFWDKSRIWEKTSEYHTRPNTLLKTGKWDFLLSDDFMFDITRLFATELIKIIRFIGQSRSSLACTTNIWIFWTVVW